ncbi:MAG TPA: hypothetical protein VM261_23395 [Kofleriaceae bacterium]|nr:hypothetical protein [Kofleriaceae bacterium]
MRGSNVQIDFGEGVPAAADRGVAALTGQAPADTFFTLYAADYKYADVDGDGRSDVDMNGEPVITEAYLFEVQRFEIRKLINRSSPCFIDLPGGAGDEGRTLFPGIHITQHAAKVREVLGVTNPLDPAVPYDDAVRVLTADRRVELLPRLENELKAVTSSDATVEAGVPDFEYPPTTAPGECGGSVSAIPHPTCTDDESNALRLRLCQEAWAEAGPSWYEGSDKVFTLPMNGRFYGLVEGMNPINDGFVGGSGFYVDENLVGHDAYLIRYQWKDYDGDGMPDVPAGQTFDEIGKPYLEGHSEHFSRGVTNATFRHATEVGVRGELAVFPELSDDSVHF